MLQEALATSIPLVQKFDLEIDNVCKNDYFGTGQGAWTLSPRRYILDSILIDAASHAGATVWQGAQVTQVVADPLHGMQVIGISKSGHHFQERATIVIGADGRRSLVARHMAASIEVSAPSRLGGWYAYYAGLDTDVATWALGPSTSAGAFPTHDGLVCVWSMCDVGRIPRGRRDRHSNFLSSLEQSSARIFHEVSSAQLVSSLISFGSYPGYMRTSFGPGWALVGDASCFAHPITAHGISDAFRDAQLLANAVHTTLTAERSWGDAARIYTERQRDAMYHTFEATQKLAALEWSLPDVIELISQYRYGVHKTVTLESEWWGECDLVAAA